MQISGAGLGCGAAKPAANGQGTRPLLFPHQVVQTQLEDFRAMLVFVIDRIQFRDGFRRHAEFGITTSCAELSLEV
jgi:hypothetical protein